MGELIVLALNLVFQGTELILERFKTFLDSAVLIGGLLSSKGTPFDIDLEGAFDFVNSVNDLILLVIVHGIDDVLLVLHVFKLASDDVVR